MAGLEYNSMTELDEGYDEEDGVVTATPPISIAKAHAKAMSASALGKSRKYPQVGSLKFCDRHEVYFPEWRDACPVCDNDQKVEGATKRYEHVLNMRNDKIKLLSYQLNEERELHAQTKLEVADYLVRKKQVQDEVKKKI